MGTHDVSGSAISHARARVIFLALAASPLVLAGVLWLAHGRADAASGPPGLVAWVFWGALSGTGLTAWWLFRRMALTPVAEWSRHRREERDFTTAKLLTFLVIAWAGAEGVGFAGVLVYFFLGGSLAMLATSLAASVLCFGLSVPREAWFRTLEREA